jgi:hypothetical protein
MNPPLCSDSADFCLVYFSAQSLDQSACCYLSVFPFFFFFFFLLERYHLITLSMLSKNSNKLSNEDKDSISCDKPFVI